LSAEISWLAIVGDLLVIVMIYSVAMAQWRNPEIFRVKQINESATHESSSAMQREGNTPSVQEREVDTGTLDSDTRGMILASVKKFMQEEVAYTNDKLSLINLSEAVGVSSHHLSEVLNQQEGKNFYQFVNEYRIEHICEALKLEPKAKILDLAIAGGFSSKSTFNTVFKQYKGKTPSQFRKELLR